MNEGRDRMVERFKLQIYRIRTICAIRRHLKMKYGPVVGTNHNLKIQYGWIQPSLKF